MAGRRSLVPAAASLLVAGAVVIACGSSGSGPGGVRTVTVTPTAAHRAGPSPTPTPTQHQTKLGGPCDSLLPLTAVQDAIGTLFSGRTAFIVGVKEPNIGRLAYVNCRYGIPPTPRGGTAEALIEIGVSLYRTRAEADRRVRSTVFDYLANGARREDRIVGGHRGVLLTGGAGEGYTVPTLVLTAGQRTVAVSLAERAGTQTYRWRSMVALAELALARTAG